MTTADDIATKLANIYRVEHESHTGDELDVWQAVLEAAPYESIKNKTAYQPDRVAYIKKKIYYAMSRYHPTGFVGLSFDEDGAEDLIVQFLDAIDEEIIAKIPDTSKIQSKEDGFTELANLTGLGRDVVARVFDEQLSSKLTTNADLNNMDARKETIFKMLPLRKDLQDSDASQRYYEAVLHKTSVFIINEQIQKMQAQSLITPPSPRVPDIQTLAVNTDFIKNSIEG